MFGLRLWATATLWGSAAYAYIPAVGVNDTSSLINSDDLIHIAWLPNGIFSAGLSRQLVADPVDAAGGNLTNVTTNAADWTKFSKGVLVHFSEQNASQAPSTVPWIAMINCDTNGTEGTFSIVDDIFTLSRDHGAQAALLYSLTSQGCLMNKEYLDVDIFEKPIDVYGTTSLQAARTLESQFNNVGSFAYHYNSQMLNDSASIIDTLLAGDSLAVDYGRPAVPIATISIEDPIFTDSITEPSTETSTTAEFSTTSSSDATTSSADATTVSSGAALAADAAQPTPSSTVPVATRRLLRRQATTSSALSTLTTKSANYLLAVMAARNVTVGQTSTPSQTAAPGNNSGPNTGLAMIILYAITGVVTAMFLIVILSGAIRAIRHPERYGPRAGQGNRSGTNGGAGQSRTRGLTRAILDTFPVVKFGRTTEDSEDEATRRRDEEGAPGKDVELHDVYTPVVVLPRSTGADEGSQRTGEAAETPSSSTGETSDPPPVASSSSSDDGLAAAALPLSINPADVDHGTTCPICVCEFEDGEDIRILPCDARHQFHRDCIDPWLLQVSSLCPLCRLDLSAGKEEPGLTAEEEEAAGEERVISNLRQMWQDRRGSAGGRHARESTTGTTGTVGSRSRFFRYVANRRGQTGGAQRAQEAGPSTVT